MFGALKRGFQSMASLMPVRNVVGELQPKRTLAASRGSLRQHGFLVYLVNGSLAVQKLKIITK